MKLTPNKICYIFFIFTLFNFPVLSAPMIVPAAPKISASSYLLADFNSGEYLVEENSAEKLPPASLTKIMTVYVVAHALANGNISLDDEVLVSEKAWRTEGSRMFIEAGNRVKVDDLLHGVVIQSGNDASVALAEFVSGTEHVFADLMNKHADRLGMKDSHFMNSTGLPHEDHYTTAKDLVILARALIKDYPEIYALHQIKEFTFNNIKQHNRNKLLWRDHSVDGIKTGHTKAAGYCLVASAVKDDMRLISVVMGIDGANTRANASQALLNYGFRFYETHKIYSVGDVVTDSKIWKANTKSIKLGLNQDVYITVPRGQYDKLEPEVEIDKTLFAPINQGEQQGSLHIVLDGKKLQTVPLIALETVALGGMLNRLKDELYLLFE